MNQQILQITLSTDEQQVFFLCYENEKYIIHMYDLHEKKHRQLYTTDVTISSMLQQGSYLFFLEGEQLQQLKMDTLQVAQIASAKKLMQFSDTAFTYMADRTIMQYDFTSATKSEIVADVEELYPSKGALIVYKKQQQIFYTFGQEHVALPDLHIESAALSFDGQFIALFAAQEGERHFFVYDLEQRILQNMTQYLGEQISYSGPELLLPVTEIPSWTETNAFYFLVTANDEVRLYYGDLYGTLLPASPEEQYIYHYCVANSGNWSINAVINRENEHKIVLLDVTTGIEVEILL